MTTDFSYNEKTINSGGPIKPSGINQPLDPRTEVKLYADIKLIPNPYVGMIITVLEDETNSNKMTDYKVLSLKSDDLGVANSVVDRVQRYVEYLGVSTGGSSSSGTGGTGLTSEQEEQLNKIPEMEASINNINESLNTKANTSDIPTNTSELYNDSGFLTSIPSEYVTETEMNEAIANVSSGGSVSQDDINTAVNNYFRDNPVTGGATTEQANQIETNKTDIATLKELVGNSNSGLVKAVANNTSQLENKANKNEISNLQTQINNLVLGAVGDGNNAEVVQARGDFKVINDRLDNTDICKTDEPFVNILSTKYFEKISGYLGATLNSTNNGIYNVTTGNNTYSGLVVYGKLKKGKRLLVCFKMRLNDSAVTSCSSTYVSRIKDTSTTPLTVKSGVMSGNINGEWKQRYVLLTFNDKMPDDLTSIEMGIICQKENTTFEVKDILISYMDNNMELTDLSKYNLSDNYYWEISPGLLNMSENYTNNQIKEGLTQSNNYTDTKIAEIFSMPFVEETKKLTWTTKTCSAGTSLNWWIENKSKDLLPNSTYLYIVKWEGGNQSSFQKCNEMREYSWYNSTTVTNQSSAKDTTKVMTWIFRTEDTVTSPSLCCVVDNPTLDGDVNLTVELYRIIDENYINATLATNMAKAYLKGNIIDDYDFSTKIKWSDQEDNLVSKWKGKNALVIGDSITAAGKWQLKLEEELGMNVTTHAKGGIGILSMVDGDKGLQGDYDNETNASGEIKPLNADKVRDKDLIVILPAYNERHREYGQIGDLYPSQNTIMGMMQYQINRIYEELTKANNLNCKILIATPHCAGKYSYIDADGYEQFPADSGRTMQTLSNTIKEICNYNNIPVCDLWHNSGINKFTWNIYGANANAVNENYTKYELDAQGEVIGETPLRYVTGQSYYQHRDGSVTLEKYTGASPYPFNGDQLHCSDLGYARIGECIVGSIIRAYGY